MSRRRRPVEGQLAAFAAEHVAMTDARASEYVPTPPWVVRLDAWRALARGQLDATDTQGVRRWLYVVAKRRAANFYAARARSMRAQQQVERCADVSPSAEDLHLAHAETEILRDALRDLSMRAPERYAVVARYELDAHRIADIAAEFAIPVNTAWNRLRLGRCDLRALVNRKRNLAP